MEHRRGALSRKRPVRDVTSQRIARPDEAYAQLRTDLEASSAARAKPGTLHNPVRMRRPALLTMVLAGIAVAVMLACGAVAAISAVSGVWLHSQIDSPTTVVENFYSALANEDFPRAYGYLTVNFHQDMSQDQFTSQFQGYDLVSGVVNSYTITSHTTSDSAATVTVAIKRRGSATAQTQTLDLVYQNNAWRINRVIIKQAAPTPVG